MNHGRISSHYHADAVGSQNAGLLRQRGEDFLKGVQGSLADFSQMFRLIFGIKDTCQNIFAEWNLMIVGTCLAQNLTGAAVDKLHDQSRASEVCADSIMLPGSVASLHADNRPDRAVVC